VTIRAAAAVLVALGPALPASSAAQGRDKGRRTTFEASFTPCVEIGWRLAFARRGAGYATEGARAVRDFAFGELGLDEIVSFTVPDNVRSGRVMEA
jgi:GNAT acetyltransferase-like protein